VVASDNVKLESSSDGRVHWLIIDKVGVDDEGEYTVRATTDVAQISSTANVLIQRAFNAHHFPRIAACLANLNANFKPRSSESADKFTVLNCFNILP